MRTFTIQAVPIVLEVFPGVWMPSPNGLFYANHLEVAPGERIIDIGTGSGILAIWAAKAGAVAHATDTDERAVRAARHNAGLNAVSVMLDHGELFGSLPGPFDAIFANLPNEIVAPAHLAELALDDQRVLGGGPDGNAALLALLDAAPPYMHATSRLYLAVHSLTNYQRTLRHALARYRLCLRGLAELPAKAFVAAHAAFYRRLQSAGTIALGERQGAFFTVAYVYELRLGPAAGTQSDAHLARGLS